jgi:uncharacterized membrane protein YeaQ/YmgE (transglycosylase-associated protein family)
MVKQIRHDADLVSGEGSLHHFSQSRGWAAALLLLVALSTHAFAQAPLSGSAQLPSLAASLPDAPQSQIPPTQTQPQIQSSPSQAPQPDDPASIRGVVVDRDGAVYEGVHITLTQPPPNAGPEKIATSDSNGRFQFSNVPAGAFQLTASSNGFVTQTVTGILHPGENYEAPSIVLPFAATTSEVQVTASRFEVAEEQLHEEEQQRVLGVIPNFYVVYAPNAAPLTSRQKFHLAWKSLIDPVSIAIDLASAGVQQANDDYDGFGQGTEGYAKRFGAAYGTDAIGTMLGAAILPSLLHQDPRYFYKGTGTKRSRALYAIAASVMCKSDQGHWQPNYSTILGGLAAGGIANLYYPEKDRNGVELSFENVLLGIGGAAVENLFQEFVVRKLTPRIPNYKSSKP